MSIKGKIISGHVTKTCRGIRGKYFLIFSLGTRWRWSG